MSVPLSYTSLLPSRVAGLTPNSTRGRRATLVCEAQGKRKVVVVGGGVGGLVSAGRLAKEGFEVELFEKNAEVGGRCQSKVVGDFRFDTGPSLLLFPDTYRETFELLGSNLEHHVDIRRIEPACYRVFFEQGPIDMLYDVQKMIEQLNSIEEGAGRQYTAWLADSRAALEVGVKNFIERDFDSLMDFFDLSQLLPLLGQVNPVELLGNHHWRLSERFRDPRLRALFSFQDLYVGLTPYNSPGVFSLLAATELTDGVWYPMGGFQKIRDGLRAAAEAAGVKIHTGTKVTEVPVESGSVKGVTLADGTEICADAVILNPDLAAAYGLLNEDGAERGRAEAERLSGKLDYSAGVIGFNWSLTRPIPALGHHSVFLSEDFRTSWDRARSGEELVKHPNFYVHAPARTDPSAAPPGGDSVMVLLPVANMQERIGDADYSELVDAGREAVLRTMESRGCGDVRAAIASEFVIGPPEWRSLYGIEHGAVFGLSHGLDQLAALRPPVQDAQIEGLFFAGASTRPGNGVPLCMIGGRLTSDRVIRAFQNGA